MDEKSNSHIDEDKKRKLITLFQEVFNNLNRKEVIIIANKSNKIGAKFENRLTKQFEKYKKEGKAYIFKIPVEFTVLRKGK